MSYKSCGITDSTLEDIIDDAYPWIFGVPGISRRIHNLLVYYKSEEHRIILGDPRCRTNLSELVAFILSPHACICRRHSEVEKEKKSLSAAKESLRDKLRILLENIGEHESRFQILKSLLEDRQSEIHDLHEIKKEHRRQYKAGERKWQQARHKHHVSTVFNNYLLHNGSAHGRRNKEMLIHAIQTSTLSDEHKKILMDSFGVPRKR